MIKEDSPSSGPGPDTGDSSSPKRESQLYQYMAPQPIYCVDWSWRRDFPFRLAFTSFVEKTQNQITVVQLDEASASLKPVATADHPFPPTKVMWMPYKESDKPDLFASTGDVLRIWEMRGNSIVSRCALNSVCLFLLFFRLLISFPFLFLANAWKRTSGADDLARLELFRPQHYRHLMC
jgi:hypothetical protein